MSADDAIDQTELHAYVDGELTPERRAEVERILAERPDLRAEVEAWSAQKDLLGRAAQAAADGLGPFTFGAARIAPPRRRWALQSAAAAALVVAGAAGGWFARGDGAGLALEPTDRIVGDALVAHAVYTADQRRPVELAASERAFLDRWLSRRVGRDIEAPDLTAAGLEFVGGRLVEAAGRPAALFVYVDDAGRRVSLMMAASDLPDRGAAPRIVEAPGAVSAYAWADNDLQLVLAAAGPSEPLAAAARLTTPARF